MELSDFYGLVGVPVIVALVALWKGWVADTRTYPLVALVLGVALNVAIATRQGHDLLLAVLMGVVVGLAASGLYSQGKTFLGG